jgi:hypothetical protein
MSKIVNAIEQILESLEEFVDIDVDNEQVLMVSNTVGVTISNEDGTYTNVHFEITCEVGNDKLKIVDVSYKTDTYSSEDYE